MSLVMTHGTRKIRRSVTYDGPGRVSWVAVDLICKGLSSIDDSGRYETSSH